MYLHRLHVVMYIPQHDKTLGYPLSTVHCPGTYYLPPYW